MAKKERMKRFLSICAVVLATVGCANFEEGASLSPTSGAHHTISAVTDLTPLSRVGFERVEGGYKHFWEANDEISLLSASTPNACFALIDGVGGNSAKFSGYADLGSDNIFAVYPYNEATTLSGSTLSVEYPSEQCWRADKASYDKESYLMVANGTTAGLKFKNITSVVCISLTGDATITKLELCTIGNESIAGRAEVSFNNGEPMVALKGGEEKISLTASMRLTSEAQHLFVAIPPVALSKGFAVTIYDNAGYAMTKTHTFNRTIERNTVVEMPAFAYVATDRVSDVPVADLLDIAFMADGTAKDLSPRRMGVQTLADALLLQTPFDYTLGQYIARFDHADRFSDNESALHESGYYRVDFANDAEFKSRIADGHSWETLFMMDASSPSISQEDRWFGSMQSGGAGFSVLGAADSYQIEFAVNLTTTGSSNWVRCKSNVSPQRGQWYHAVGVWDKEKREVSIYIDGVKRATTSVAEGAEFFLHNSADYHWICVGANTENGHATQGWDGDVAIARIYDKPLTDAEVSALYNKSYRNRTAVEMVTDAKCLKEATVSDGYSFMVKSGSFIEGDKLRLRSHSATYECATTIYPDGASLTIPADFVSGIYNLELVRGGAKQVLAEVNLTASVVPQADMLDVVFNADGTAYDASGMQSEVVSLLSNKLLTYSNTNDRYIARFMTTAGSDNFTSGFYYVPYVKTEAFALKQADGHSFEAVALLSGVEDVSCLMATHQSGGTAFRFQASERDGVTHAIEFAPYVGGAYKFAFSEKSKMELNKFYHLVGVWNKSTGEVVLYVNGEQAGIVTGATGAFKDSKVPNLVIGGDPGSTSAKAQNAWNGDIATARVYDKPLSANEAKLLYEEALKSWPRQATINVSGVRLFSGLEVAEGWKFSVYGNGIKVGDTISLKSLSSGVVYECVTTSTEGRSTIVIPQGLPSDSYNVVLCRGDESSVIASTTLTVTADALLPRKPKVIAHRGCWYVDGKNNVPENSIAGLQRAQTMEGVYSVEFDVWMTADDVLVINHDATIEGITIQNSNYSAIENITLSNGEKLPRLDAYLDEYAKNTSIKMLLHLKGHATTARTKECVDAIVVMLRERGILAKTEWLVPTYDVAKYIIDKCKAEVPDLVVACAEAKVTSTYPELGNGMILNYKYTTVDSNPSVVKQAHLRGLEMIVWSITSEAGMLKYMSLGIDYFNCNRPALLAELNKLTFIEE